MNNNVRFSVAAYAAWAPACESDQAWLNWANSPHDLAGEAQPKLTQLPAMQRRRTGFLGKMALEVAFQCLAQLEDDEATSSIPVIFCSRHGDVARAYDLLSEMIRSEPLSPTSFGLAVHNASAGLFSIARQNQANQLALAAGSGTVEYGVIEACSLIFDGAPKVLMVVYDMPLPEKFSQFEDCAEQPHAWAWIIEPPKEDVIQLSWHGGQPKAKVEPDRMPASLAIWQYFLLKSAHFSYPDDLRTWCWTRDVK